MLRVIFVGVALLVASAEGRWPTAFVANPAVWGSTRTVSHLNRKRKVSSLRPLYVSLLQNETIEVSSPSSSFADYRCEDATSNSVFPVPPPPPTDEELHAHGLPILVEAAKHAEEGRIMCNELPEHNNVAVGYNAVLEDATRIALYVASKKGKDWENTVEKPRTIAHLTEPGSEYVASLWGTWAAGYCTVPLATSHRAHEFEHVLKDANPDVILIGGHVTRRDEEDGTMIKTLPPHNEGELLQAANALGLADRIVYLRDLIGDLDDVLLHDGIVETTRQISKMSKDAFALGANGSIPSLDTPAMLMYTSGTTGLPKGCLTTQ